MDRLTDVALQHDLSIRADALLALSKLRPHKYIFFGLLTANMAVMCRLACSPHPKIVSAWIFLFDKRSVANALAAAVRIAVNDDPSIRARGKPSSESKTMTRPTWVPYGLSGCRMYLHTNFIP